MHSWGIVEEKERIKGFSLDKWMAGTVNYEMGNYKGSVTTITSSSKEKVPSSPKKLIQRVQLILYNLNVYYMLNVVIRQILLWGYWPRALVWKYYSTLDGECSGGHLAQL